MIPASAESTQLRLSMKMLAIMEECAYIQKDKRNEFHRYNYASEAAIKEKVHAALVRHKVLLHVNAVALNERQATTSKDGVTTITTQTFEYWFEDAETGEESAHCMMSGSGADPLDKGIFKSTTGALKYLLTTTFLIPTGDDPENETEAKVSKAEAKQKQKDVADRKLAEMGSRGATIRDVPVTGGKVITDGQRKRMYALKNEAKLTDEQCKLILGSYGFTSSTHVTIDLYDAICADITRCGLLFVQMPMCLDYKTGNHVLVQGKIYRLTDSESWEEVKAL